MPTEQTELREKLAAIEHERWADWQKWVHKLAREDGGVMTNSKGELSGLKIPQESVERWEKQITTPYYELSDAEKASDMEQVDRYWPLIEAYIVKEQDRIRAEVLDEVEHSVDNLYKYSIVNLEAKERNDDEPVEAILPSEVKSILASLREEGKS